MPVVSVLAVAHDTRRAGAVLRWGVLPAATWTRDLTTLFHSWNAVGGWCDWTWSLSMEEQYYLLWAPLCWWCLRRRAYRLLVVAAGIGVILPVVERLFIVDAQTVLSHRMYVGPDTRADALFVGCLLALLMAGQGGPAYGCPARGAGRPRGRGLQLCLGARLLRRNVHHRSARLRARCDRIDHRRCGRAGR